MQAQHYPIGVPDTPWGDTERAQWLARQQQQRSYSEQVEARIQALQERFDVSRYGELDYALGRYPLYRVASRDWRDGRPRVLVTGGVHGYETSGVQGALRFLADHAQAYAETFDLLVLPCISPWAYETINRWNPEAVDPNRSFYADSPAPESALAMACIRAASTDYLAHIDLHETTDTDNSEFRPALAARDGVVQHNWNIPDGFYLVGDSEHPTPDFQRAVLERVEQVTHIAPADDNGCLIGEPLQQRGVINYDNVGLGLCAGVTNAPYVTTTEVYPDSPRVDDENCTLAQVAAVCGALDYLAARL